MGSSPINESGGDGDVRVRGTFCGFRRVSVCARNSTDYYYYSKISNLVYKPPPFLILCRCKRVKRPPAGLRPPFQFSQSLCEYVISNAPRTDNLPVDYCPQIFLRTSKSNALYISLRHLARPLSSTSWSLEYKYMYYRAHAHTMNVAVDGIFVLRPSSFYVTLIP